MKQRQQGLALIALLAIIVLGASWWLVSALATPANRVSYFFTNPSSSRCSR